MTSTLSPNPHEIHCLVNISCHSLSLPPSSNCVKGFEGKLIALCDRCYVPRCCQVNDKIARCDSLNSTWYLLLAAPGCEYTHYTIAKISSTCGIPGYSREIYVFAASAVPLSSGGSVRRSCAGQPARGFTPSSTLYFEQGSKRHFLTFTIIFY